MKFCKKCGIGYCKSKRMSGLCPRCEFWSNVDVRGPDDCWLWNGNIKQTGYGSFDVAIVPLAKNERLTHRVSWSIANGPIPPGMYVLHCCDDRYPAGDITNRRCVNPAHIRIGTPADNMRDCASKGRMPSGSSHYSIVEPWRLSRGDNHYSRLHPERLARGDANGSRRHPELLRPPRGEAHPTSKLTEQQVLEIANSTERGVVLAKRYNIGQTSVSMIRKRKVWKHLLVKQ